MTISFEAAGPDIRIPADIKRLIKGFGAKRYMVSLTPVYGRRSQRQNAYFHVIIGRIAAESGTTPELVKDLAKQIAMGFGYPPKLDASGNIELASSGEAIPKPSSEADSREMGILIDAAIYLATEHHISVEPFHDNDVA